VLDGVVHQREFFDGSCRGDLGKEHGRGHAGAAYCHSEVGGELEDVLEPLDLEAPERPRLGEEPNDQGVELFRHAPRLTGIGELLLKPMAFQHAAQHDAAAEGPPVQDSPGRLAARRLALAIAERLPKTAYPPGLTHDLLARALGSLADALRLAYRLDAARAALRKAGLALKRGTGDDLEQVALLRVGASVELA